MIFHKPSHLAAIAQINLASTLPLLQRLPRKPQRARSLAQVPISRPDCGSSLSGDSRGGGHQRTKLCNPFCCLTTKLCPASRNAGTLPMRHGQLPVPEDLARASAQAFAYPLLFHRSIVLLLSRKASTCHSAAEYRLPLLCLLLISSLPHHQGDWGLNETGQTTVQRAARRLAHVLYETVVCAVSRTAGHHLETKPSFLLARRITRLSFSICSQGIDPNFTTCSSASTLLDLCG
jgi:hypothetical protein